MKNLLLTIVMGIQYLSAQLYTPNTYYVIPPNGGCNGVWAVEAAGFVSCGPGATYIFTPFDCANFGITLSANMDTAYIQLCSTPCNMQAYNTSSAICNICSIFENLDLPENGNVSSFDISYDHSLKNIQVKSSIPLTDLQILDVSGRRLHADQIEWTSSPGTVNISVNSFHAGVYICQYQLKDGNIGTYKFYVN